MDLINGIPGKNTQVPILAELGKVPLPNCCYSARPDMIELGQGAIVDKNPKNMTRTEDGFIAKLSLTPARSDFDADDVTG